MKLRNKKTGEIIEKYPDRIVINSGERIRQYDSLTELNSEWEDVPEEPKRFYWLDYNGDIYNTEIGTMDRSEIKEIGNLFETKEQAEQAVEKLKAWKRLNNCGLKFIDWWLSKDNHIIIGTNIQIFDIDEQGLREDLDLLFGGKD